MIAGPDDMAYVAVLNQFNEPQGNLHHMTVPVAEMQAMAASGQGSVTARSAKARITFATGHHDQGFDINVQCEDIVEGVVSETEVERFEFEALVKSLGEEAAAV